MLWLEKVLQYPAESRSLMSQSLYTEGFVFQFEEETSLPYFEVKLSSVCLMFAYRKK